ncbi:MAG: hypothetical protein Alpg2KO_32750 [Alphaproteobacteria bacterium]
MSKLKITPRILTWISLCLVSLFALASLPASAFQLERPAMQMLIWAGDGPMPVPQGLTAHSVAVGESSVCAVGAEGRLACFGCHDPYSDWGQCDIKTYADCDKSEFACDDIVLGIRREHEAPAVAISTSRAHGCQVVPGGIVQCWGCRPDEFQGQCQAARQYRTRIPSGLEDAEGLLLTGWYHSCFLDDGGKARCFGCADDDINQGQCSPPEDLPSLVSIAGEGAVSCGIDGFGKVHCWGSNAFGQLDVPEGLTARDLAVGPHHACAVSLKDQSLSCWGCQGTYRGQDVDKGQCRPPADLTAQRVEAGRTASCALNDDGKLTCWGCDGELDGPCKPPRLLSPLKVTDFAMGGDRVAALLNDDRPSLMLHLEKRRQTGELTLNERADLAKRKRAEALVEVDTRARVAQEDAIQAADYTNHLGMLFRTIPAGASWIGACGLNEQAEQRLRASGKQPWEAEVTMRDGKGCPPGMLPDPLAWENEHPVHIRHFPNAFQIGTWEVTRGEYAAFIEDKGIEPGPYFRKANPSGEDDHPVVWVNQAEALAFIAWLNDTKPDSDKGIYRLPTEGEWEYAARGPNGMTRFPWGDQMGKGQTNCAPGFCAEDVPDTHPVGAFPANAFGLHGMIGNVDEWVQDCMSDDHRTTPRDDSAYITDKCTFVIARGGSWKYPIGEMRVSYRDYYPAAGRTKEQGFRIVRQLPR